MSHMTTGSDGGVITEEDLEVADAQLGSELAVRPPRPVAAEWYRPMGIISGFPETGSSMTVLDMPKSSSTSSGRRTSAGDPEAAIRPPDSAMR